MSAGVLSIVRLNRLLEMTRMHRSFVTFNNVDEYDTYFLAFGRHWKFYPALFDRAAVDFPMLIRSRISAIGRSSFDTWQTVEDEKDGSLLASLVFRLVNIDPVVRGAGVPIPDNVRQGMLRGVAPDAEKFPKIATPHAVPKDAFSCRIKVRYDDMDLLFHTNQGSYPGFMLECAAQAAEAGYYSEIREDVAFLRPRWTTGIYLAESHAGDELDVSTWENADNKMLLNFLVSRQGTHIYYAQLEYYK